MSAIAKFENLKDLIVELRGQSVLLDSDVAELYRVETKRINEAVKNDEAVKSLNFVSFRAKREICFL